MPKSAKRLYNVFMLMHAFLGHASVTYLCSVVSHLPCCWKRAEDFTMHSIVRRWRAAALEALHAFIAGPLAAAPPAQCAALQEGVAALLAPTLDAICACPPLQVKPHMPYPGSFAGGH